MVKQYRKGESVRLSPHIWLHEFDCHCRRDDCTITLVNFKLITAIELLREVSHAIYFDCGFRCAAHNAELKGAAKHSQHLLGNAADIKTPLGVKGTYDAVLKIPAFEEGGVGLYPQFVHVDVRGRKARW